MALYMTQFSYTSEAWTALAKQPADRRAGLRTLFERLGGRLVELYYSFGDFDGVVLFEAPDDTTATAGLIAALGPGHLKAIKTTKLLSVDETLEALRRAGSLTYAGPGR
ncbi:MAG: GYD domain-containing protein [Chloroflexota bacterium]|nr:GYD domain-containing protein [Chloroflexota bacterium]